MIDGNKSTGRKSTRGRAEAILLGDDLKKRTIAEESVTGIKVEALYLSSDLGLTIQHLQISHRAGVVTP